MHAYINQSNKISVKCSQEREMLSRVARGVSLKSDEFVFSPFLICLLVYGITGSFPNMHLAIRQAVGLFVSLQIPGCNLRIVLKRTKLFLIQISGHNLHSCNFPIATYNYISQLSYFVPYQSYRAFLVYTSKTRFS